MQGQNVVDFPTHRQSCSNTTCIQHLCIATIIAYSCVYRKDIKNMILTPKYLKVKSWGLSTSTSRRERSNDPVASNIFESKEHTSSLFAKIGNPKKMRLLQDLLSNLDRTLGQKPPRTPGAFLHVGKTGEADLTFFVAATIISPAATTAIMLRQHQRVK